MILKSADHDLPTGATMAFTGGSEVNIPRNIATALIARGVAKPAGSRIATAHKED